MIEELVISMVFDRFDLQHDILFNY